MVSSIAALAKSVVILQGPCATTVAEDPIPASMISFQSAEDQISVREHGNDHVKSDQQMAQHLLHRNASVRQLIEAPSLSATTLL